MAAGAVRRFAASAAEKGWQVLGLLAVIAAWAALPTSAVSQQTTPSGIGGMWTGKSGDDSYLVIIPDNKGTLKITLEARLRSTRVVRMEVKEAQIRPDGSLVAGKPGTTGELVMSLRPDGLLEKRRPKLDGLPGGVVVMGRVKTSEEWRHNERISKELRDRSAAQRAASGRYTIRGMADDRRLAIQMDLGPGGKWSSYGGVWGSFEGDWGADTRLRGQIHGYVETPDADGSRRLRLIADYGMVEATRNKHSHRELSLELAFAPKKAAEPEGIFVPIVFEQMPTGAPGPTSRGSVLVQRLADVNTAAGKPQAGAGPPPRQDAATPATERRQKALQRIATFRFPDPPDCGLDIFPMHALNASETRRMNDRGNEWKRCLAAASSADLKSVNDFVVELGGRLSKLDDGRFRWTSPSYCACKRELEALYEAASKRDQARASAMKFHRSIIDDYNRQVVRAGEYYPGAARDLRSNIRRYLDDLRNTKPNLE
ncbi:MAG: hypothetical protein AB7F36_03435 [Reyranellaceae bacterium]